MLLDGETISPHTCQAKPLLRASLITSVTSSPLALSWRLSTLAKHRPNDFESFFCSTHDIDSEVVCRVCKRMMSVRDHTEVEQQTLTVYVSILGNGARGRSILSLCDLAESTSNDSQTPFQPSNNIDGEISHRVCRGQSRPSSDSLFVYLPSTSTF